MEKSALQSGREKSGKNSEDFENININAVWRKKNESAFDCI